MQVPVLLGRRDDLAQGRLSTQQKYLHCLCCARDDNVLGIAIA